MKTSSKQWKLKLIVDSYEPILNTSESKWSFSYQDFLYIIQSENFEGKFRIKSETAWNPPEMWTHKVLKLKKDIKYIIRLYSLKLMTLIGTGEFVVPVALMKAGQKEFNLNWYVQINTTETTRKFLITNKKYINDFTIGFNISIYGVETVNKEKLIGFNKTPTDYKSNSGQGIRERKKSNDELNIIKNSKQIMPLSPRFEKTNFKWSLDENEKRFLLIKTPPAIGKEEQKISYRFMNKKWNNSHSSVMSPQRNYLYKKLPEDNAKPKAQNNQLKNKTQISRTKGKSNKNIIRNSSINKTATHTPKREFTPKTNSTSVNNSTKLTDQITITYKHNLQSHSGVNELYLSINSQALNIQKYYDFITKNLKTAITAINDSKKELSHITEKYKNEIKKKSRIAEEDNRISLTRYIKVNKVHVMDSSIERIKNIEYKVFQNLFSTVYSQAEIKEISAKTVIINHPGRLIKLLLCVISAFVRNYKNISSWWNDFNQRRMMIRWLKKYNIEEEEKPFKESHFYKAITEEDEENEEDNED